MKASIKQLKKYLPAFTVKQQQHVRLAGLLVGVILILGGVLYLLGDHEKAVQAPDASDTEKTVPLASALDTVTLGDRWLSQEDTHLHSHDQLLVDLQKKIKQLSDAHKTQERQRQTLKQQLADIKKQQESTSNHVTHVAKLPQATNVSASSNPIIGAMQSEQDTRGLSPFQTKQTINTTRSTPFKKTLIISPNKRNEKQKIKKVAYLPAGTFVKAILLGGLDAATNLNASSNPRPVLLKLIDQGQLPNHHHAHLKGCVITAAGMGDVSSERGYIRLERLSCIKLHHGEHEIIDVPVFGTVFGPSGQDGVRGRAVYRAKQLITNSFAAGLASGLGKTLQDQSMNAMSATPYGMAAQLTPAKTLEAGAVNGANTALDRLADYYIKRAERYHPILQIHAGTLVDVVFLKGVALVPYQASSIDGMRENDRDE